MSVTTANATKVKRNNRGMHPNSKAALRPPIAKGEVRNQKGKAKGTVDNRTAYLLGFNPRGAKDFDLGVKHRQLADLQESMLRAIYKSLINEEGELILLHSSDIEIRYETTQNIDFEKIDKETGEITTTTKTSKHRDTASLIDLLNGLESETGIKILHVQQTKDLLKEAGTTSNQFRQTLSDIADVLGVKSLNNVSETQQERDDHDNIYNQAIAVISRRNLPDEVFANMINALYFDKFQMVPPVNVLEYFKTRFEADQIRWDVIEVKELTG